MPTPAVRPASPGARGERLAAMHEALEALQDRRLVVVTGKGGVGKSAVAATLARLLSGRGRRSLVMEIDPRETVHQMYGVRPSGGEVLEVAPGLWLQNLQPRDVLDQLVRERVPLGVLARRVIASPIYEHFTQGCPGLEEMAILGYALRLVEGTAPGAPELDVVVLDAPASGHGVSLLEAPSLVASVIREGPIGEMTRAVRELVGDPRRFAVVVVTLAEEMPVNEALELEAELLRRLGRRPDLVVVNGLYPPFEEPPGEGDATAASLARDLWRSRRRINEAELERLEASHQGPRLELPLLPRDRGPGLIRSLQERLEAS